MKQTSVTDTKIAQAFKKKKTFDSRAKEFVNIVKNGTPQQLLNLYYKYKGFYKTGTADFVQQVVVDFMEEYCIEIKKKTEHLSVIRIKQEPTIEPKQKHLSTSSKQKSLKPRDLNRNKFGDDWNIDFEDPQPHSRHPSVMCESEYGCNQSISQIPTIFQSSLYFRKQKYYLELFSDPFYSTDTVKILLSCFTEILHKRTTEDHIYSTNPWNFTLYSLVDTNYAAMIYLFFKYDSSTKQHTIDTKETEINFMLKIIIKDMHKNDKYMTTFVTAYECSAGLGDESVGGAHAVTCGIIKKEKDVFVFILDSNGVQLERSSWWQQYMDEINKISSVPYDTNISNVERVEHFFNEHIVETVKSEINELYPNEYNFIADENNKINLNPHDINVGGSDYQQGGYCLLISYFFIHILYNNIVIHNRSAFAKIEDISKIIEYIEDLMIFIYSLIKTDPFTNTQFFYNYSINIFRFMLSVFRIEDFYEVHNINKTKDIVNAEFANNPHRQNLYLPVESGNVMSLYMKLILEGKMCLPSLIGVSKLCDKSIYEDMLKMNFYSCIKFYTPFRKAKRICNQPLRLFFTGDTEQVEFGSNSIFIRDTSIDRSAYNDDKYLNSIIIMDPSVVLLNLAKVNFFLNRMYDTMIKDFNILYFSPVQQFTSTCLNMSHPHAHIMKATDTQTVLEKSGRKHVNDNTTNVKKKQKRRRKSEENANAKNCVIS